MSPTSAALSTQIQKIKSGQSQISRAGFYQSIFKLKDKPLSLDHARFWEPIVNNQRLSKILDKSQRQIVCRTSRQVYKTTTLAMLALGLSVEYDHFTTEILEPTDKQVTELSNAKIQDIESNSIVTDVIYFDRKRNERQVRRRAYANGSRIILANIHASVLSARGISSDATFFDEVQDLPIRNIAIIESSAQRSEYKFRFYAGTPLEEENHIETLWESSTQNIWVAKCSHCGYWNGPMGLRNIGMKGLICQRCHGRLSVDPRVNETAQWYEQNPGVAIDGYHINELMLPPNADGAMSWQEVIVYLDNKDEQTINNEFLGKPHKGSRTPLTMKLMRSKCGDHPLVTETKEITPEMKRYTFAGLDWAMRMERRGAGQRDAQVIQSYTTLSIGTLNPTNGKIKILFMKRFYDSDTDEYDDPDYVVKEIIKWNNAFQTKIMICDFGVGHKENQRIMSELGRDRVMEVAFVGELEERIYWDVPSQKFVVARTKFFDEVIDWIKRDRFIFPQFDGYFSEFVKDFTTNHYIQDVVRRVKKYGQKDANDAFINMLYIMIAVKYFMNELDYKLKQY